MKEREREKKKGKKVSMEREAMRARLRDAIEGCRAPEISHDTSLLMPIHSLVF